MLWVSQQVSEHFCRRRRPIWKTIRDLSKRPRGPKTVLQLYQISRKTYTKDRPRTYTKDCDRSTKNRLRRIPNTTKNLNQRLSKVHAKNCQKPIPKLLKAYTTDCPRPIPKTIKDWQRLYQRLWNTYTKDCERPIPKIVKYLYQRLSMAHA